MEEVEDEPLFCERVAGARVIRGDLRDARGTDVACRSGGVLVTVRGGSRPRAVPVLARYHARLTICIPTP